MPIRAALIANGRVILVHEHLSPPSARSVAVQKILDRLGDHDQKRSFTHADQTFHCLTEDKMTYMCVADTGTSWRTVFCFLDDVKIKFKSTFAATMGYPRFSNSAELTPAMCARFPAQLAAAMRWFNDEHLSSRKNDELTSQMDAVKKVVMTTCYFGGETELDERINDLITEPCDWPGAASLVTGMSDDSRTLNGAPLKRNLKILAVIVIALLLLSLIVSWIACGIDYKKCKSVDDSPPPSTTETSVPGVAPTSTASTKM